MNWPVVGGVLSGATLLISGVLVALVKGWLQKPEQRANVAKVYTEVSIEWLREYRVDKQKLLESNVELNHKLDETKSILLLLVRAVEQVIPILRQVTDDENNHIEMEQLSNAMSRVQSTLNGN